MAEKLKAKGELPMKIQMHMGQTFQSFVFFGPGHAENRNSDDTTDSRLYADHQIAKTNIIENRTPFSLEFFPLSMLGIHMTG